MTVSAATPARIYRSDLERLAGPLVAGDLTAAADETRERLDAVVGPENWRTLFRIDPSYPVAVCGLSIRVGFVWIRKSGVAGAATAAAAADSALVAAARQWGIGRPAAASPPCNTAKPEAGDPEQYGKTWTKPEPVETPPPATPAAGPDPELADRLAAEEQAGETDEPAPIDDALADEPPPPANPPEPTAWTVCPFPKGEENGIEQARWYVAAYSEALKLAGCDTEAKRTGVFRWATGAGSGSDPAGMLPSETRDPRLARAAWLRFVLCAANHRDLSRWIDLAREAKGLPKPAKAPAGDRQKTLPT